MPPAKRREEFLQQQVDQPPAETAPVVAQMVLRMHADGRFTCTGPLQDKAVCYVLLEFGKDQVKDFHDQGHARKMEASPILQAGALQLPK